MVTIPAIRTGVMLGVVESSMSEVVQEIVMGITRFESNYLNSNIKEVVFVVYNNDAFEGELSKLLACN